jgi:UDP-N-acetylmuramyl pentapeptide synthase
VPNEPLLEPYLQRTDIFVKHVDDDAPIPFPTNYSSQHQLANTRTAIAVADCLDVPLPGGELVVEFSKLREEELPLPGEGRLLNDCYNAELVRELGVQVIAVGELARAYGGDWVETAGEAAQRLRADLRPGDVVLVKGSRSVGLEVVAENITD